MMRREPDYRTPPVYNKPSDEQSATVVNMFKNTGVVGPNVKASPQIPPKVKVEADKTEAPDYKKWVLYGGLALLAFYVMKQMRK